MVTKMALVTHSPIPRVEHDPELYIVLRDMLEAANDTVRLLEQDSHGSQAWGNVQAIASTIELMIC